MLRNLRQRERERERSRNKDMTQCSRCEGPWSWILHRNQKQSLHVLILRSLQEQLSPETGEQSKKAFEGNNSSPGSKSGILLFTFDRSKMGLSVGETIASQFWGPKRVRPHI